MAGLALGHGLARTLGSAAHWISAGLLFATGVWTLVHALRPGGEPAAPATGLGTSRLIVTGLALSIDNLAVGFALGAFHVSLAAAIAVIGSVSIALSLAGLKLGARIGAKAGHRGEILGAVVLLTVGAAIAANHI